MVAILRFFAFGTLFLSLQLVAAAFSVSASFDGANAYQYDQPPEQEEELLLQEEMQQYEQQYGEEQPADYVQYPDYGEGFVPEDENLPYDETYPEGYEQEGNVPHDETYPEGYGYGQDFEQQALPEEEAGMPGEEGFIQDDQLLYEEQPDMMEEGSSQPDDQEGYQQDFQNEQRTAE